MSNNSRRKAIDTITDFIDKDERELQLEEVKYTTAFNMLNNKPDKTEEEKAEMNKLALQLAGIAAIQAWLPFFQERILSKLNNNYGNSSYTAESTSHQ